jgi:Ni/Co efflux regulator RcnB
MRNLLAVAAGLYLICGAAAAQDDGHARTPDEGAPPGTSMQHESGRPMQMPDNRTDRGTLGDQGALHAAPGNHRNPGTHADFSRWHANEHATRRYHAGEWPAPSGYHYRRWAFGERLPPAYYARDFWIGSYGVYGLMAPPSGTVWVRYGPDALLVDRKTGEIIRVEYGIFY